jgi:hypothetical protein
MLLSVFLLTFLATPCSDEASPTKRRDQTIILHPFSLSFAKQLTYFLLGILLRFIISYFSFAPALRSKTSQNFSSSF